MAGTGPAMHCCWILQRGLREIRYFGSTAMPGKKK
jgi:hypothetical protein